MTILTRYILKQLIVSFTLILLGMTTLVWLTQSLRMIDMIVTKGVPVHVFLEMTILVLPNFIQILSPLALFAVILFIFSRMQADKEIMVMQAAGMSNTQISKPAIMLAIALTIFGYIMSLELVPSSHQKMSELKWQVKNDLSHLLLQEGQFNHINTGLTLYIKNRENDGSVNGVLVYDSKNPKNISMLIAEKGYIYQKENGFDLIFQQGTRQEFNPETKEFSILKFNKYNMFFNDKKKSNDRDLDADEYDMSYLIQVSKDEVNNPILYRKYKTEALKRITKPLYNITFMFLAIFAIFSPFYNRRGQMGRMNSIILFTLIVQSLALAFENLTAKNLWLCPLMFINIVLPIFIIMGITKQQEKNQFKKLKETFKLLFIAFILFGSATAIAQIHIDPQVKIEKDKPVDFEADEVIYNKNSNILTAKGNVIISQNGTIVKTEEMLFDKTTNKLVMPSTVEITTPDGTITYANNAVMSSSLNEAISNIIRMQMYEGSLLTAQRLKRKDNGTITYLKKARYTPCSFCEGEKPLWELTARNFKHNKPSKTMSFIHSFLQVKEIPIFYFPYINVPDFTVKRKTGLLAPSFEHSNELEQAVNLPFFINIADNQNLTIRPTFSTSHDPLGYFDYEGLFTHGYLKLQGSGTRDNNNKSQGHIKANMQYDISNQWRLSGQYYRTSSDTYFRRYSLPDVTTSDQYLESNITLERFGTKNYFNFKGLSFQNLRNSIDEKSIPVFIPTMNYYINSNPLNDTGLYSFSHINAAFYNNRQRFKSNRITATQGLQLPYVSTRTGFKINTKAYLRADGYSIDTGEKSFSNYEKDKTYSTGRFLPTLSTKISYPFAKTDGSSTQVIEPILMLITSPVSGNKEKIPNIDSLDTYFDDTNLFSENRYTGYDRVETGTRANYGIQYASYGNNKSVLALFGQSYRFSGDDETIKMLGDDSNYSDFVGRLQMNYDIFSLAYRFKLDKNNFQPQKNEITFTVGKAPLRFGVDYMRLKSHSETTNTYYNKREEILLFGSSQLTKNWSLTGYYRYNLEKESKQKGPVEQGITATYENDCLIVAIEAEKSFTYDRDYEGDTSIMINFILKTLGGMQ